MYGSLLRNSRARDVGATTSSATISGGWQQVHEQEGEQGVELSTGSGQRLSATATVETSTTELSECSWAEWTMARS